MSESSHLLHSVTLQTQQHATSPLKKNKINSPLDTPSHLCAPWSPQLWPPAAALLLTAPTPPPLSLSLPLALLLLPASLSLSETRANMGRRYTRGCVRRPSVRGAASSSSSLPLLLLTACGDDAPRAAAAGGVQASSPSCCWCHCCGLLGEATPTASAAALDALLSAAA